MFNNYVNVSALLYIMAPLVLKVMKLEISTHAGWVNLSVIYFGLQRKQNAVNLSS